MKSYFPRVVITIIVATGLAFALELAFGGLPVCQRFGFVPAHPSLFTALASMWVHDSNDLWHIGGNLLMLLVVGTIAELEIGGWRVLALFIASGLGGAAMHWLVEPTATTPLVGCSGSLCGLMAVAAVARPREIFAGVVSFIAMNILGLCISTPLVPAGVSAADHVGGFIVGSALVCARAARCGLRASTLEARAS